jgi:FkbM family methyltransferase
LVPSIIHKLSNRLALYWRRYVLRDRTLLEFDRWFRDKGDETLRLKYPLTRDSVVFDLGGYRGDFAAAIHERYGCKVFVFEPVPQFYRMCVERFRGNEAIRCFDYGLSDKEASLEIVLDENGSSFFIDPGENPVLTVQTRSVARCIRDLGVRRIDLIKINIEGGEYDVIPALLDSGCIALVNNLQVQFHRFVEGAETRRAEIRRRLANTHSEQWNYEFVWESWALRR